LAHISTYDAMLQSEAERAQNSSKQYQHRGQTANVHK
jgi:hypothetical protein